MGLGDSIFIAVRRIDQSAQAHWIKRLRAFSKQVVVDSGDHKVPIRLSCVAPTDDACDQIERQLRGYFQRRPHMSLITPWSRDDSRSADEVARHDHARELYAQALAADASAANDSQVVALDMELNKAMRANDGEQLTKLMGKVERTMRDARDRARAQLLANTTAPADREFLKLYVGDRIDPTTGPQTQPDATTTPPADRDAMLAVRMGQLSPAPEGDVPLSYDDRFSALSDVRRNGVNLEFQYIFFMDPIEGASALTRWLRAQGCDQFRYEIRGESGDVDDPSASEK
jgi:hypothetical protein